MLFNIILKIINKFDEITFIVISWMNKHSVLY